MEKLFLDSVRQRFLYYKSLADKSFSQVSDEALNYIPAPENNSIAIIVQHLHGNMMSRWTDFLSSDGEKEWRQRDAEFEPQALSRKQMLALWEEGWSCLLSAIDTLQPDDLTKIIYIRAEAHTVVDAINRQLAHYPYHVGQIVFLAKLVSQENWQSLSIPKNGSAAFNADKFGK